MVIRKASKMEGRKKKSTEPQKKKANKEYGISKHWLGPDDAIVDFSDTAASPCKDFYHVFVTPKEVIFRWWKIVPPTRADSNTPPSEIRDSYDDFLHDERCHSEIQRLAGDGMLKYLEGLCSGQFDYLPRLSDELLVKIVLYLDLEDIAKLATVSKQFQKLCNSDLLWGKIYHHHCENITQELEDLAGREGWKRLFFTNKLQLQMQLRRQKRQHGDQAFVTDRTEDLDLED